MSTSGNAGLLGDVLAAALQKLGLTPARVEHWLGRPCHCHDRQARLNALTVWARRVLSGRTARAEAYLTEILEDEA